MNASLPIRRSASAIDSLDIVRPMLRAEGLVVGVAGLVGYAQLGGDWLWLVPLLLVPDLSLLGYLAGPAVGALVYDLTHNLVLGIGLVAVGLGLGVAGPAVLGSVLVAHVGLDRLVGYGLKHPTGFRDTHLQRA